jgi:hypothetical protein
VESQEGFREIGLKNWKSTIQGAGEACGADLWVTKSHIAIFSSMI